MEELLKWIGILTLMYLSGRLVHYILKKLGIRDDMTWKDLFKSKNN